MEMLPLMLVGLAIFVAVRVARVVVASADQRRALPAATSCAEPAPVVVDLPAPAAVRPAPVSLIPGQRVASRPVHGRARVRVGA